MKQTQLKSYKPLGAVKSLKSYSSLKSAITPLKGSRSLKKEQYPGMMEADSAFSKRVIERDKQCLRCGTIKSLTCSHFFGRSNFATRYLFENCITLCLWCHEEWESKKRSFYRDFMMAWLGMEKFEWLESVALIKISPREAIKQALENLKITDSDIQY